MALFSLLIKSKELEEFGTDLLIKGILHYDLIHKIIQRSEDSNSWLCSKIHDLLMDFSFHPLIGEEITMSVLNERII